MSFLGRLGETLQDTGWSLVAPFTTAFDVARATFDDDRSVGQALTTGINRGTQLFLGDNNGTPDDKTDDTQNLISPGVGKVMDGLEWVYDNAIAQPINTGNIVGQRLLANINGVQDNASPFDVFGGDNSAWARADESTGGYSGQGTSIGREAAYTNNALLAAPGNLLGKALGIKRLQMPANISPLTDDGQRIADEQSKLFDIQSGLGDAAARLFLDPTIVLGKASKALKFQGFIRNVKSVDQLTKMLSEDKAWGGVFQSFGKRFDKANDFNMGVDVQRPRSALEIYAANPGMREAGASGWGMAQAMESASRQLWKDGADVEDIRQTGRLIGLAGLDDPAALKSLDDRVAAARDALAAQRSTRDDLQLAAEWNKFQNGPQALEAAGRVGAKFVDDMASRGQDYFTSDEFLALTNERLKAVTPAFRAAQLEVGRQERLANLFKGEDSIAGSLQSHPPLASVGLLGRESSSKAMAARAAKETGRTVDRAKYNPARLSFVFQTSLWNKAVKYKVPQLMVPHIYYGAKAAGLFRTPQAPRIINLEDKAAPTALNNFLKHSAVSDEQREKLVGDLASSRTEGQRRNVMQLAITHAQSSLVKKYMDEHPHFTEQAAQAVIAEQAKQIQKEANRIGIQTQRFTAHTKQDGSPGDVVVDEDGVKYMPLLETQLQNHIALPDLRMFTKVLDRHSGWLNDFAEWAQGNRLPDEGRVAQLAGKVFDAKAAKTPHYAQVMAQRALKTQDLRWKFDQFADSALGGLMKFWKGSVLLRPAYPMRVLVDSDARALAVLGPVAFGQHFAPRAFGFLTMGGASRMKTHFAAKADESDLTRFETNIEQFEDAWKSVTDDPLPKDLASATKVGAHPGADPDTIGTYLGMKADAARIRNTLETYRLGGRSGRNAAYGRFGEVGLKDIDTVMGKIPGAFADDYGKQQRYNNMSKTSAALMGDSQKLAMKDLMTENWVSLSPADDGHMEAWLHAINAQLKNSQLGQKALEFQLRNNDNPEKAVGLLQHWIRNTKEGRAIKARMMWDSANGEAQAREIVGYVNHYLPTPQLRAKAAGERITENDLKTAYPDPLDRPPVHGNALARAMGRGSLAGKMINDWFSRSMTWLSDAPEDQLARHPMYAAVYEQEARRQAEWMLANPNRHDIGLEEIQKQIQIRAHRKAQSALKTYMFDVAATSDLSHALRFYSPFIAAWEDTIRKWGKIASDNPDILGKGYLAWNAPNDMGMVVDEDGHPVDKDDFTSNTYMVMQWPSWVPGVGGKKWGANETNFRIPKQAVNIILQGGLQPGFGPLVAIPTGVLQTKNPELNDYAKFINPYGPPSSVWDAMAPSTAKRVQELMDTQSRAHMYDTQRIFMAMQADYRLDPAKFDGKAPTWNDAAERAKWIGVMKVANNFANPFPAIFDSKFKLYQDAYHNLQDEERRGNHDRGWADDEFMKDYGETFFPLVQSMSKNYAGLGATAEAVDASKRYEPEISKFGIGADGKPNANLIRLIIGDEGEGAYNASAHAWQESQEISPGAGYTYRSVKNSQEASADADADLGWYKYRKFMDQLEGDANSMGLRTYSEDPDLTERKQQFVAQLKAQIPSWRADYEQMDQGKFTRDLESLSKVAVSTKFPVDRTDMAGVRQYLALRQALQTQLKSYDITEGSADAQPFRQEFTEKVMDLVGSNTKFAEWAFHPFLERDPLLEDLAPYSDPTVGTFGVS